MHIIKGSFRGTEEPLQKKRDFSSLIGTFQKVFLSVTAVTKQNTFRKVARLQVCPCEWGLIRISTIPLVTAHPPALLAPSSYKGHF